MSLLDRLLSVDKKTINEQETKVIYSKKLQKLLGDEEPVAITIRSLNAKRINRFVGSQYDKKGNYDFVLGGRAKAHLAVDGIVEPDLKNAQLMSQFDCENPSDLAEKMFGMELPYITDEICRLSGMRLDENAAQEEDEEIKNS